jgi:type II secretory ATPase GspE/PulE/Tfp pilus assembly ATPase PilB-like protein
MLGALTKDKLTIEELVNAIFEEAVADHASDIHLEPLTDRMRVRFRIDGTLYEKGTRDLYELEPVLTSIKVLASLDITTRPVPQDGHFELWVEQHARTEEEKPREKKQEDKLFRSRLSDKLTSLIAPEEDENEEEKETKSASKSRSATSSGKRPIDVRVSIFPTVNGESAVMRLLNREEMLLSIDALGMDPKTLKKVKQLVVRSYGMVLVTGPAGSGKTTLLYSILRELTSIAKNIVTLEDPVEFNFGDIRQIQMRPEQGFTFAIGMRSILRQDPDVVMIGEIRDPDTAEHAVRAALTGRIVFSTVHSNTTVGTIARLIDMNVERSLIAYAINGVMSKRLVKTTCHSCRTAYKPEPEYLKTFGLDGSQHQFTKGKGCDACGGTGYQGRTGIFEVLEFDNTLRSMIIDKAPMNILQEYAEKAGMKTLKQDAIEKVLEGQTTLEEVARTV